MKIRGTCSMCGRDFLVQEVLDSQGHCPSCGRPFQPHYTAVLAEALQQAEAAGGSLENALEKLAGMAPAFVLDEDSVNGQATAHLARIRGDEKPRYP